MMMARVRMASEERVAEKVAGDREKVGFPVTFITVFLPDEDEHGCTVTEHYDVPRDIDRFVADLFEQSLKGRFIAGFNFGKKWDKGKSDLAILVYESNDHQTNIGGASVAAIVKALRNRRRM